MYRRWLLVALGLGWLNGVYGGSQCDSALETQVNACLQPMLDYATSLQDSSSAGVHFPLQGSAIFEKLCGLYSDFQKCTSAVTCRSQSIEAIQASYGYMCGEGYQLFQQHVHCFAEVEMHPEYLKCKGRATNTITGLHLDAANPSAYLDSLCEAMVLYLQCSHPIILSSCGKEAWQLVRRVTEDSLKVTMPNCNLRVAFV